MLLMNNELINLPNHFNEEIKELLSIGVNSWGLLSHLNDCDILKITNDSRATAKNLIKLRGIAKLICEMSINFEEAALLIHSGIASKKALAKLNPQELIMKTGRLERQLITNRQTPLNLKRANYLIKKANNPSAK